MPPRIVTQHDSPSDLYRHLSQVFHRRAAEQLRAGRNPEQAAMLAAEYSQRAKALEAEVRA